MSSGGVVGGNFPEPADEGHDQGAEEGDEADDGVAGHDGFEEAGLEFEDGILGVEADFDAIGFAGEVEFEAGEGLVEFEGLVVAGFGFGLFFGEAEMEEGVDAVGGGQGEELVGFEAGGSAIPNSECTFRYGQKYKKLYLPCSAFWDSIAGSFF